MDKKNSFHDDAREVGLVVSCQDYLLKVSGLPSVSLYDVVVTRNGARGLVNALTAETVEVMMLDAERPRPGDYLEKASSGLQFPLTADLFGRLVSPLGVALDGGGEFSPKTFKLIDLDATAPGIETREIISEQFYTGLVAVDTLMPVGRGQRELILCDPRSGKRAFFQDVILAQGGLGRVCIYAAVGRSETEIRRFYEDIKVNGAASHTIVVAASSDESAPMIVIGPAVAMGLAEYYRDQGKHVLLIIDDLATHAKYAREIALLAGRVPGRESYPADIFYQHSSLVERAGNFNSQFASGSITLLPCVVAPLDNFSSLIPTNVMSMTDGHLLLSSALRSTGRYPALDVDHSVTRVGRQTQHFLLKELSDKVRRLLAEYHDLERYARFGSELSAETQLKIIRGKVIEELLRQEMLSAIAPEVQILLLSLVFSGYFDGFDLVKVREIKAKLIKILQTEEPFIGLGKRIKQWKLVDLLAEVEKVQRILSI